MAVKRTSVLVYKSNHGLVRLYCPFEVIGEDGGKAHVEYIVFAPNLPYFKIGDELLPCYWFSIILK